MKKLVLIFLGGFIMSSCNNESGSTVESNKDSSSTNVSTQNLNYPYTIAKPDNWDPGSQENTMNVLTSLKAYENGQVEESLKYFGDSVHLRFDGLDTKVSKDTLRAMFTEWRNGMKSLTIKMEDWVSVISKDKKDEYVTMWYQEKWEDNAGKIDSTDVVNDFKMKDGKIIVLSQYTRKYH